MPEQQQSLTLQQAIDLGVQHHNAGRLPEAESIYKQILQSDPDQPVALHLLGVIAHQVGKNDTAVDLIARALALKPDFPEAHNNLGNALKNLEKLDEAVASYHKALAIKPDYADAHNNLGVALQGLGKSEDAIASYHKALAIKPDYAKVHSNLIFCLNSKADCTISDLFAEARRFGAMVATKEIPVADHANNPDPDRRLRVGLVSGDFRYHSISQFLDNVLSEIDVEKLEIFAYATSTKKDAMTAHLKRNVPHWRDVAGMDDRALTAKIVEDGIDILVDLSGHTAHNRLQMFARKPAPVQVTWLGFGGTTGIDAIDFILCDKWVIPPENEKYFSEKPWRLPDTWLCYSPPEIEEEVTKPPALNNSYVTFGCFNNLSKLSDAVVPCWSDILHGVPDSRLYLKTKHLGEAPVRDRILSEFASYGIPAERLLLHGRADIGDHYMGGACHDFCFLFLFHRACGSSPES